VDVIGGIVAQEYRVDWGQSQSLQAVGKLAPTAGNTEAWLAAKSTAEELCLRLVGIGQENTDGGAASVRAFHSHTPSGSISQSTFEVDPVKRTLPQSALPTDTVDLVLLEPGCPSVVFAWCGARVGSRGGLHSFCNGRVQFGKLKSHSGPAANVKGVVLAQVFKMT
jgi:hypothetical protein